MADALLLRLGLQKKADVLITRRKAQTVQSRSDGDSRWSRFFDAIQGWTFLQQNDRSAVGVFENASVFADRDGAVGAFESIAVVNLFKVPVHQLSAGCIVNGGAEAICRESDGFPDQHPVTVAVAPVDDKILHASQIFDFPQRGIRLLCFFVFLCKSPPA